MIVQKLFILVGISFACRMDQAFLNALSALEDDLQIGDATWIVVNPSAKETKAVATLLCPARFPSGKVLEVNQGFGEWVVSGCPELKQFDVL